MLHYHVIMAQCSRNDESCRSLHRLSASPRTCASPAAPTSMRAAHAENTPPVSQILAHHERQSSLVVVQVVGRQLPLRVVAAVHRLAPTTHRLLARGGQKLRRLRRSFCAGLPALTATYPISVATGPTRSSGLSRGCPVARAGWTARVCTGGPLLERVGAGLAGFGSEPAGAPCTRPVAATIAARSSPPLS